MKARKFFLFAAVYGIVAALLIGCATSPMGETTTTSLYSGAPTPPLKSDPPPPPTLAPQRQSQDKPATPTTEAQAPPQMVTKSMVQTVTEAPRPADQPLYVIPQEKLPPAPDPTPLPKRSADEALLKAETLTNADIEADRALETGPDETSEKGIVINLDNAELAEVVRKLANLLKINYIASPNIGGKVSVYTAGSIRREDLYQVFMEILKVHGLTAIKEGELYHILPVPDAARLPIMMRKGVGAAAGGANDPVVIQLIGLQYITASELVQVLKPLISAGGTLITHPSSNTLLVVDTLANLQKIIHLVEALDINIFERFAYKIFQLKHQPADQMGKELNDFLSIYGAEVNKQSSLIAIDRLNIILAVSAKNEVIEIVARLIEQLDIPADQSKPRIFVYTVKSSKAKELSELLNIVFSKKDINTTITRQKVKEKNTSNQPFPVTNPGAKKRENTTVKIERNALPGAESGSGTLDSDVYITPDEARNALIIEATPPDYQKIENLLGQIDKPPRQVLIEVVIAEIKLDDSLNLGVEWNFDDTRDIEDNLLTFVASSAGLNYTVGITEKWLHSLNALAKEEKVDILSSPSVLASDGKEAKINVADQLPVVSSEFEYTDETIDNVVRTNIQYRDTGIILSVTPHISERGLVTMELVQEVSEQGQGVEVAGKLYPSFLERKVETTLTVGHGQTIVIGGLMRETKGRTKQGVPFLSKIPFIGWIFGQHSDSIRKTELIFLITPKVIIDSDDIISVTEEFKQKVRASMLWINKNKVLKEKKSPVDTDIKAPEF